MQNYKLTDIHSIMSSFRHDPTLPLRYRVQLICVFWYAYCRERNIKPVSPPGMTLYTIPEDEPAYTYRIAGLLEEIILNYASHGHGRLTIDFNVSFDEKRTTSINPGYHVKFKCSTNKNLESTRRELIRISQRECFSLESFEQGSLEYDGPYSRLIWLPIDVLHRIDDIEPFSFLEAIRSGVSPEDLLV